MSDGDGHGDRSIDRDGDGSNHGGGLDSRELAGAPGPTHCPKLSPTLARGFGGGVEGYFDKLSRAHQLSRTDEVSARTLVCALRCRGIRTELQVCFVVCS